MAFVGTGHRAELYLSALLGAHAADAVPVVLADTNPGRLDYYKSLWRQANPGVELATVELDPGGPGPEGDAFADLLVNHQPDIVLVASVDRTHARYVTEALDHGCDVICEKPLTTDVAGCQAIAEAARRSTGRLVVTMNYRYSPRNSKVKELILSGEIGEVTSIHFEWQLDTSHGADYFRRWHRQKANSGGLLVHKSSHHFDLINWWLADRPQSVMAQTSLRFYGADNAQARGLGDRPARSHDALRNDPAHDDPFAIDLAANDRLRALYLDSEHHDGYVRDADVFGGDIDIDDNMAVLARYEGGALLTYSLVAHAPWEGYRVAINGTEGRIDLDVVERAVTAPPGRSAEPDLETNGSSRGPRTEGTELTIQRHWESARSVPVGNQTGAPERPKGQVGDHEGGDGHGGGDALLLADLFSPAAAAAPDPLGRQATHLDGLLSVLTGLAANRSAATGGPVLLRDIGEGILDRPFAATTEG